MSTGYPSGKSKGEMLTNYVLLDTGYDLATVFHVTNWPPCFLLVTTTSKDSDDSLFNDVSLSLEALTHTFLVLDEVGLDTTEDTVVLDRVGFETTIDIGLIQGWF